MHPLTSRRLFFLLLYFSACRSQELGSRMEKLLLVRSARQVVTVTNDPQVTRLVGQEMKSVTVKEGAVSIVVDNGGFIEFIGSDDEVAEKYRNVKFSKEINASNYVVLPGFIDTHTHPVWAGDRVNEFAMKLAGATYLDIHASGGGIFFTVEKTKNATDQELADSLVERLSKMLRSGTTTVECKSGYGLDLENEIRLLKVIESVRGKTAVDISSTYCGAHAVPKGLTAEEATIDILERQIPELKNLIETKTLNVENIDVFCEKGVFTTEQSKRILEAGKQIGLRVNFHGDELYPTKSAEMGASIGATAISHLEEISEQGIADMAANGSVAVILPTTAYTMRLKPPPVRRMIEAGVAVALGTDFNPNAFCYAMPMVMNLACVTLGMSMPEALIAATLNAAASLGRSNTHGSITRGKFADFLLVRAPRWEHIIYQMGAHEDLIDFVVKNGKVVFEK
ncbi:probable imidazolonepropionase [Neocloeon triangulifer]|uniref:probable imidazolonepropionase n=1 Tax=Neocloeon triangulifer TaxID=2078957 RepID=UPI00286F1E6D|nr:probable imidazolonepropionase [Neocloeon triangulifer]